MLTIHKSLCSLDQNRLITEASTANLNPGEWPDFISVVDDAGVGYLFGAPRYVRPGGELQAVIYTSRQGHELHVLND